jgi:hypothetical protein
MRGAGLRAQQQTRQLEGETPTHIDSQLSSPFSQLEWSYNTLTIAKRFIVCFWRAVGYELYITSKQAFRILLYRIATECVFLPHVRSAITQ